MQTTKLESLTGNDTLDANQHWGTIYHNNDVGGKHSSKDTKLSLILSQLNFGIPGIKWLETEVPPVATIEESSKDIGKTEMVPSHTIKYGIMTHEEIVAIAIESEEETDSFRVDEENDLCSETDEPSSDYHVIGEDDVHRVEENNNAEPTDGNGVSTINSSTNGVSMFTDKESVEEVAVSPGVECTTEEGTNVDDRADEMREDDTSDSEKHPPEKPHNDLLNDSDSTPISSIDALFRGSTFSKASEREKSVPSNVSEESSRVVDNPNSLSQGATGVSMRHGVDDQGLMLSQGEVIEIDKTSSCQPAKRTEKRPRPWEEHTILFEDDKNDILPSFISTFNIHCGPPVEVTPGPPLAVIETDPGGPSAPVVLNTPVPLGLPNTASAGACFLPPAEYPAEYKERVVV